MEGRRDWVGTPPLGTLHTKIGYPETASPKCLGWPLLKRTRVRPGLLETDGPKHLGHPSFASTSSPSYLVAIQVQARGCRGISREPREDLRTPWRQREFGHNIYIYIYIYIQRMLIVIVQILPEQVIRTLISQTKLTNWSVMDEQVECTTNVHLAQERFSDLHKSCMVAEQVSRSLLQLTCKF